MRCYACNNVLSDFEACRKGAVSGEYLNLCNKCLKGLGISTIDRADLEEPYQRSLQEEDDLDVLSFVTKMEEGYYDF